MKYRPLTGIQKTALFMCGLLLCLCLGMGVLRPFSLHAEENLPQGGEQRVEICLEAADEEEFDFPARLLFSGTDGAGPSYEFYSLGTYYGREDLALRSNGADRQAFYDTLEGLCRTFSRNAADAEEYRGYHILGRITRDEAWTLSTTEAVETYFAFRSDHPEYYWLSNRAVYSRSGDLFQNFYVTVYDEFASVDVRETVDQRIEEKRIEYVTAAGSGTFEEQLCRVYAKLISELRYASDDTGGYVHSLAGGFGADLKNEAVCEGFAKALQLVLNDLGIPNLFVAGNMFAGTGHAWNLVQMEDGLWYGIDATWENTGGSDWQFFLKGEENFAPSHTPLTPDQSGILFQYALPVMSPEDYWDNHAETLESEVFEIWVTIGVEEAARESDPTEGGTKETVEEPLPGEDETEESREETSSGEEESAEETSTGEKESAEEASTGAEETESTVQASETHEEPEEMTLEQEEYEVAARSAEGRPTDETPESAELFILPTSPQTGGPGAAGAQGQGVPPANRPAPGILAWRRPLS